MCKKSNLKILFLFLYNSNTNFRTAAFRDVNTTTNHIQNINIYNKYQQNKNKYKINIFNFPLFNYIYIQFTSPQKDRFIYYLLCALHENRSITCKYIPNHG